MNQFRWVNRNPSRHKDVIDIFNRIKPVAKFSKDMIEGSAGQD